MKFVLTVPVKCFHNIEHAEQVLYSTEVNMFAFLNTVNPDVQTHSDTSNEGMNIIMCRRG